MFYLFLLGFLIIYVVAPIPMQILILIVDAFVPDPIPAMDEIFMVIVLGNRIRKMIMISNFVKKHKFLTLLIGIVFAFLLYTVVCEISNIL